MSRRVRSEWCDIMTATAVFSVSLCCLLLAGMPVPTLFAAMFGAATFAIRSGRVIQIPRLVRDLGMATVGVAAGGSIDGDVMNLVIERPVEVLGGVLCTIVLSLAAGQLLRLSPGLSFSTAAFASIAGGASGVSLMARDFGADDAVVLVVQYLRVVFVLLSVPLIASVLDAGEATNVSHSEPHGSVVGGYAFFIAAILIGLTLTRLLRFTAAEILYPLVTAAVVSVWGVFGEVAIPEPLTAIGYAVLGLSVGVGFTIARLRSVARHVPIALIQIVIGIGACACAGLVFARLVGISQLDGYLATSPGGLAAIIAVSLDSGGELGLIVTMQFVRVFLALALAPLIGYLVSRRRRRLGTSQ